MKVQLLVNISKMEHQDWTTITLKKKNTNKKPKVTDENSEKIKKNTASKNTQKRMAPPAYKIEERVDSDDYKTQKVSHSMQLQIQQARQAKNWTQKQLAQISNIQQSIIRDYENGTIIPNQIDIMKIGKALGCNLHK